jgi:hypothetical protein
MTIHPNLIALLGPAPCCDLLFLLTGRLGRAGRLGRLPSRTLLARRGGKDLYLLFLGLLGFPIASLLAVGHLDLPWLDDACDGTWPLRRAMGFAELIIGRASARPARSRITRRRLTRGVRARRTVPFPARTASCHRSISTVRAGRLRQRAPSSSGRDRATSAIPGDRRYQPDRR